MPASPTYTILTADRVIDSKGALYLAFDDATGSELVIDGGAGSM